MKKKQGMIAVAIAAILATGTLPTTSVFAAEAKTSIQQKELQGLTSNESKKAVFYDTQENAGVNDVGPGVGDPNAIVSYGTSKPTSTWNLSTQGGYGIEGSSNGATLYTNYLFTGKSSFTIKIRNNDNISLKFKLKRKDLIFDNTIGSYEIPAGKDGTVTVSVDKSSNYYLEFTGPNKFRGTIN
ncbi:TPA: hypothetical protein QCR24_005867 [Bacillus cereus]|nr:hypothetical protein [Bacillus cereus]